jgi:Uma2 family endonuclease
VIVTCDRRDNDQRFVRHPKLIIEVLPETTERVDRREKFLTYTTIESLQEYVLVAQDKREVTVFRREAKWKAESVAGARAVLALASLGIKLPLAAIYEGV